jgi:hypothetical protein
MVVEPLAQVPFATYEPVRVAVPVAMKLAVFEENVATDVLLELQTVEAVTSAPFSAALKTALVPLVNVGPAGIELMVSDCPPLTLPVAEPAIPPTLAVIVTLVAAPMPSTRPALTVAQGVELCQDADFVTSLLPLLKAAVAKS